MFQAMVLCFIVCSLFVSPGEESDGHWNVSGEMNFLPLGGNNPRFASSAPGVSQVHRNETYHREKSYTVTHSASDPSTVNKEEMRCHRITPLLQRDSATSKCARVITKRHQRDESPDTLTSGERLRESRSQTTMTQEMNLKAPAYDGVSSETIKERFKQYEKDLLPPTKRQLEEYVRSTVVPKMRNAVLFVTNTFQSYDRERTVLYIRQTCEETMKWLRESQLIEYILILMLMILAHVTVVLVALRFI